MLSLSQITSLECHHTDVVPSAVAVRIQFRSFCIDSHLFIVVVRQCSGVKDFLDIQLRRIALRLEAFPVLSCVTSVNRSVNFHLLQFLVQIFRSVTFTIFSQRVVQFETTIRRSVSADLDSYILVRSLVCVLNKIFPFFDSVRIQFLSAKVSLLDQEHDVSVMSLFDNTLEFISCDSCCSSSCVCQFGSSDNAFTDLYVRQFNSLVFDLRVESQIQF